MKRSIVVAAATAALFVGAALPAGSAGDPYRSRQWGLDRIHADDAWRASKGSGVKIAIVDSGIDLTHPDLRGKVAASYSCVGGACGSGGDDDNGHGSHVAGIAAAATANGIGVAGVAPAAKLMAVKVIAANGSGACSDVELGIRWAADHGADVINLSLGPEILKGNLLGVLCIDGLQQAASYAWDKGDVVVIAAGNDYLVSLYSSSDLLVVGATGADDFPASYSNSGADVYAPGGDPPSTCNPATCVFSTYKDGAYASIAGTSMAAPHVSGIAALLLAKGYSNSEVLARIKSTADAVHGIRRVNAARAVGAPTTPSPGTKTSKSKPRPPASSGSGGSGGGGGSASTGSPSPNTSRPKVLPTKLTPPATGSPTGGPLASGPAPRRPAAAANRASLIAGAVALALLVLAGTFFLRRRSKARASP